MPRSTLPLQPTSFVGRRDELTELGALLQEPACRLLTLVGPGGIGKTRVAIAVATQMAEHFADGVYFVDLQAISTTHYLISTIAEAIGVTVYGPDELREQLVRALNDRSMLLVMDNFEHLLDGVDLLVTILDAAPAVKILVTSREILNLQAEWLYPVQGLRFPPGESSTDTELYDAIQLFTNRAQQVRNNFSLSEDRPHVIRICQLVEGMPLALELAANWLRAVSCARVASEIEQSLAFLATSMRDLPARHQSMWGVINSMWHRLTHDEREVFKRIAVFQGGFRLEAAEQVAEASLSLLAILVDRSLLRITPTGRYEMHDLIRQYAEGQLKENPGEWEQNRNQHCSYYAEFVSRQEPLLKGPDQIDALARITDEIANVRAAWQWAATRPMMPAIGLALNGLNLYYEMQSMRWEQVDTLQMALTHLDQQPSDIRGRLMIWHAISRWRVTRADAEQEMHRGMTMLGNYDISDTILYPLQMLTFSVNQAIRTDVRQFFLTNLARLRLAGDTWALATTVSALANLDAQNGEYEAARERFNQSLALFRADGNQWGMATIYAGLQRVVWALEQYDAVKRHAEQHLGICHAIGDNLGTVFAQSFLGGVAYKTGDYNTAKQLFDHNLKLATRHSIVLPLNSLVYLAMVAHKQAELPLCGHYLREVWHMVFSEAWAGKFNPEIVLCTARLWIALGRKERAVELIVGALPDWIALKPQLRQYPSWNVMETPPDRLLAELEATLSPQRFADAKRRGENINLELIAPVLLDELSQYILSVDNVFPAGVYIGKRKSTPPHQPLIDPLTNRELDVLRLVAAGHSNREIARELVVTVGTVKKHLNNVFGKLNVTNRTQAAARARTLGLLQ